MARASAASHKLTPRRGADQLLPRLAANEGVLVRACNLLTAAVAANRRITPAGEWLLDNFYLIEEQIRTSRRHLPRGYSRALPRLADGPSAGLPRVYDLALETISHGDGRVDTESLRRFVAAYQTVTSLTLGELWAIPIMLRLALIENLRRVAARTGAGGSTEIWRNLGRPDDGDGGRGSEEPDPGGCRHGAVEPAGMTTRSSPSWFAALQGQSPALALPLTWIEQRLAESVLTIEHLVQAGNQHQAADQVSVSNTIASLRFLGATTGASSSEVASAVEQTLREIQTVSTARWTLLPAIRTVMQ
jgi:hypothetical protein